MALWYHEKLGERLQSAPRAWLYRNHDRVLTGSDFAAACLFLRRYIADAAGANGYVAIRSDKSALLLPAIVTCGLEGYAYAPVAVDTPDARISAIKAALDVRELLDLGSIEASFFGMQHAADSAREFAKRVAASAPFPANRPLYVLFTSGSSGTPKGVMVSPSNVRAFMTWATAEYRLDKTDVLLGLVPETFDLSVLDIYACLCNGARLLGVEKRFANDTARLVGTMREHSITSIFSTPSQFNLLRLDRNFAARRFPALRQLLACGEVLPAKLAGVLLERLPRTRLFNLYGPTEACVAVTAVEVTRRLLENGGSIPIGFPMGGTSCLVLDDKGDELADGVQGELLIVGDSVGLGYLGMPELTAKAFINYRGKRAYRSGDQCWKQGDVFYFAGRKDDQIKWSGYRVEIGEIEAALNGIDEIQQAVVVPRKLPDGSVIALLAIIQCQVELDEQYLVDELTEKIPRYMLPSAYEFHRSLPLTAQGKINRKAL